MKKMLALLVLSASIAMPVAAFAAEAGTDNHPDHSMPYQAPVVYTQMGSTEEVTQDPTSNVGTVAGGAAHDVSVDIRRNQEGSNR
jgi:hypothetical protein